MHVHVDEEIVSEPSLFELYDRGPQPAGSLVLLRVKQELFDSARRKCPHLSQIGSKTQIHLPSSPLTPDPDGDFLYEEGSWLCHGCAPGMCSLFL